MRGLSLLDVLIVLAVLALLVFAGRREFVRYDAMTVAATPTAPAEESHR